MRVIPLLAVLALATAGCASAGATGRDAGGAAAVAPTSSLAFVAATTDLKASEWHSVGKLVLAALPKDLAGIEDVAGDEVDVAVLPGDRVVAFVQPADEAKLEAFAAKRRAVTRVFGDWTAVAKDRSTLDAVANAKSPLAQNARYREAMAALPGDALVHLYANADEAQKLFAALPGQLESKLIPFGARYRYRPHVSTARSAVSVGVQDFRYVAGALTSEGDGLRFEASVPRGGLVASSPPRLAVQTIEPYASALVDEIPAGVLAVVDFQVPQGAFEQVTQVPKVLRGLFDATSLTLPNELDELLGGETALYVRPSLPMPEITLVTQPADTSQASDTLDALLRSSPKLADTKLYRAVIGGQFVVSTTRRGIADFRAAGAKLSADWAFVEAQKQSGMPARTTGFAYVNVKTVLPLLRLAGADLPDDVPDLRTLTAFGAQVDGRSTFTAFLDVG